MCISLSFVANVRGVDGFSWCVGANCLGSAVFTYQAITLQSCCLLAVMADALLALQVMFEMFLWTPRMFLINLRRII